ncbi:MAG: hypothetical protein AB7I50_07935 [Vicinamibacterales bacterium]
MTRLLRLMVGAVFGAVLAAGLLVAMYGRSSSFVLEMDRELPRLVRGVFDVERNGPETFAWTGERATVSLPGIDRRIPWRCEARVRGARPPQFPLPTAYLQVDEQPGQSAPTSNEYQEIGITAPVRRDRTGLLLTLVVDPVFVPSDSDRRQLGVQIDRLQCTAEGMAWPPPRALTATLMAGGAFGLLVALLEIGLLSCATASAAFAFLLAWVVSTVPGLYTEPFLNRVATSTWVVVAIAIALERVATWSRGMRWHRAARVAIVWTAGALLVKCAALLHPAKPVVDALFHAHRFEAVAAGSYFFTQPMPDGVRFPYAIALYVFALPWSPFTSDHVALLRVLVTSTEAMAGLLLYPLVTASGGSPAAAALSVVLFHVTPLPYVVVGNANLTFAFGQAVALCAVAAAASWPMSRLVGLGLVVLLLAAFAFLSHIATFSSTGVMLVAVAMAFVLSRVAAQKKVGAVVFVATLAAAALAIVLYYGHFSEVYATLDRVTGRATVGAGGETSGAAIAGESAQDGPGLPARMQRALELGARAAGWPLVILATAGLWQVGHLGWRRRAALTVAAWLATYVLFLGFSVAAPVEPRFQRYADEFVDRINYATLPAIAILAATAAAAAWPRGWFMRVMAIGVCAAALFQGFQQWASWLQ